MIEYKSGNILQENTDALINTVNCVGIMGRGIALQFKKAFPENFKAYEIACKNGEMQPGKMFIFEINKLIKPRYIINFPTKRHWRGKSRIEDIELGLIALVDTIRYYNITSVAIPPLGSGLGGLKWEEVKTLIKSILQSSLPDIHIIIYEPMENHESIEMVHSKAIPKMTPGRAALVELIRRYLDGLLDPFITLLEVHKLMYFLQETGELLKLNYQKASYGPYAANLRHVLNTIEGHFIFGYADGGDNPHKQLQLVPGAVEDAKRFLSDQVTTCANFTKVVNLVDGFESPFGLELLSSVHWIIKYEHASSLDEAIKLIYQWNEHKKQFTPRQIDLAITTLADKGWIEHMPC